MHINDLFPGSFNAESFIDGPATLTIKAITPIIFEEGGEDKHKAKVTFVETSNYWIMGKEAAGELAEEAGPIVDRWIGQKITLRRDRTDFKGKMVDCVRGSFRGVPTATLASGLTKDQEIEQLMERLAALKSETVAKAEVVAS